jgi:hypothetical protein
LLQRGIGTKLQMWVQTDECCPIPTNKKGNIVKLPLISAFLVVYILLAASWISYSQLIALY